MTFSFQFLNAFTYHLCATLCVLLGQVNSLDYVRMDNTLKGEQRETHAGTWVQPSTPTVDALPQSPSVDLER